MSSDEDETVAYSYVPLVDGEFRVMELRPGEEEDDVLIRLKNVPLQQAIDQYQALSYTWGVSQPRHEIYHLDVEMIIRHHEQGVDCFEVPVRGRSLQVSPNLFDALRALRLKDRPRNLWIDQICINQEDVAERGHQVKLMGSIYRGASLVMVWLSQSAWTSDCLVDDLSTFADYVQNYYQQGLYDPKCSAQALQEAENVPQSVWNSVSQVLKHNYFQRLWIIQEVVHAKSAWLLIGKSSVNWYVMELIITYVQDSPVKRDTWSSDLRKYTRPLRKIETIRSRLKEEDESCIWARTPKWTLFGLAIKTWHAQCQEPRDKIYGILSLLDYSDHCISQPLEPDYSIDFQELLRSVSAYAITHQSDFTALMYCHPDSSDKYPCWIVDPESDYTYTSELAYSVDKFRATVNQDAIISPVAGNPWCLHFRATYFGKVSALSRLKGIRRRDMIANSDFNNRTEVDYDDVVDDYETFLAFAAEQEAANHHLPPVALCRIWHCDMFDAQTRWNAADEDLRNELQALLNREIDVTDENIFLFSRAKLFNHDQHLSAVEVASGLRERFGEAKISWIPEGGMVGDDIVLVHGFKMPMLARRKSPSDPYKFLGCCYVDGIMDGEVFEEGQYDVQDIPVQ